MTGRPHAPFLQPLYRPVRYNGKIYTYLHMQSQACGSQTCDPQVVYYVKRSPFDRFGFGPALRVSVTIASDSDPRCG